MDEVDGQRARQTDTCRSGRATAPSRVAWRASRLDAPGPPRAARADARLSHGPGSARVGRGGGSTAGWQTGRSAGLGLRWPGGSRRPWLPERFVTRCGTQRRARARCGATADLLRGGGAERSAGGPCAVDFSAADSWAPQGKKLQPPSDPTPHPSSRRFCSLFPWETWLLFQRARLGAGWVGKSLGASETEGTWPKGEDGTRTGLFVLGGGGGCLWQPPVWLERERGAGEMMYDGHGRASFKAVIWLSLYKRDMVTLSQGDAAVKRFEPSSFLVPNLSLFVLRGAPSKGQVSLRIWILHFWQIHRACCDPSFLILPYLFAGALWTSILLGEVDYNQRSGSLANAGTDPIIKAPTKVFFTDCCQYRIYF